MSRFFRLLALALAPVVAGCPPGPQAGAATARVTPYAEALDAASRAVGDAESRAADGSWPALDALAAALAERARLTGAHEDYLAADRALRRALGASATGPCATAARIHFALHRLDPARQAIAACGGRFGATPAELAELAGIGADVLFQSGRHTLALRGYRESLALAESVAGLARLSRYYAATGAPVEALALLDRAEAIYHGDSALPVAWLALQRGALLLDQGRWDDALAHYLRAQRLVPGWWLAAGHEAEVRLLRGELKPALRLYQALAQDTGHPEFMDATATVLLQLGEAARADEWITRARALHRAHVRDLPEACADAATRHFLQFAPLEAAELRQLAERTFEARPGAEAAILRARAYLRLGQALPAVALVQQALGSGWDTAELHAVAAQAFAAARDAEAARRERERAIAMNPRALHMYAPRDGTS